MIKFKYTGQVSGRGAILLLALKVGDTEQIKCFLQSKESRIALRTDISLYLEMHGFFLVMVDLKYSVISMIQM